MVDSFFFQYFAYVISLPSGFYGFWWEVSCCWYWRSLVYDESLLSCIFQDSLCLCLLTVWLRCVLVWISLSLSTCCLLGSQEFVEAVQGPFSSKCHIAQPFLSRILVSVFATIVSQCFRWQQWKHLSISVFHKHFSCPIVALALEEFLVISISPGAVLGYQH